MKELAIMKRIDLLRQKSNIWLEIEETKRIREDEKDKQKTYKLTQKIEKLKNKYDFINALLKANKQ